MGPLDERSMILFLGLFIQRCFLQGPFEKGPFAQKPFVEGPFIQIDFVQKPFDQGPLVQEPIFKGLFFSQETSKKIFQPETFCPRIFGRGTFYPRNFLQASCSKILQFLPKDSSTMNFLAKILLSREFPLSKNSKIFPLLVFDFMKNETHVQTSNLQLSTGDH